MIIAGEVAHRFGARTELERLNGLYRADEQDAENIGDPLASLLSRHGGVVGGKMSEDANDAIAALMGLGGYVAKQIAMQTAIRKYEAEVAAGVAPPPGAAPDVAP